MELNKELLTKAKAAKTAEELLTLAKENGIEMTAEEAQKIFAQLHPQTGELSDDELDNVSGGGCHNGGRLVVSAMHYCDEWRCKDDGPMGYRRHAGMLQDLQGHRILPFMSVLYLRKRAVALQ